MMVVVKAHPHANYFKIKTDNQFVRDFLGSRKITNPTMSSVVKMCDSF